MAEAMEPETSFMNRSSRDLKNAVSGPLLTNLCMSTLQPCLGVRWYICNAGRISGVVILLSATFILQDTPAATMLQEEGNPVVFEDVRDSDGNLHMEEMPYQKPCTLEALSAAASGGFLGAVFGFGELVFVRAKQLNEQ
jgi:hypothetical protein